MSNMTIALVTAKIEDLTEFKEKLQEAFSVSVIEKFGGVVLNINCKTQHNSVDLLFISKEYSGQGLGFSAWKAIEDAYPETAVWELVTQYFEKRNIHYYVNKCGFHIVEFYNKFNPDPNNPIIISQNEQLNQEFEEFFRFEKVMKACK